MTVIRPATREDLPALLEMALAFIAADARMQELVKDAPDPTTIWELGECLVTDGGFFVADAGDRLVGFIALGLTINVWTGRLMADEQGFWVNPENRGSLRLIYQLLGAGEEWARQKGCRYLRMSAPELTKFSLFLERSGYALLERVYLKLLEVPDGRRQQQTDDTTAAPHPGDAG